MLRFPVYKAYLTSHLVDEKKSIQLVMIRSEYMDNTSRYIIICQMQRSDLFINTIYQRNANADTMNTINEAMRSVERR